MRPLHHAALVTTLTQERARVCLLSALHLDSDWRYEYEAYFSGLCRRQRSRRGVPCRLPYGHRGECG